MGAFSGDETCKAQVQSFAYDLRRWMDKKKSCAVLVSRNLPAVKPTAPSGYSELGCSWDVDMSGRRETKGMSDLRELWKRNNRAPYFGSDEWRLWEGEYKDGPSKKSGWYPCDYGLQQEGREGVNTSDPRKEFAHGLRRHHNGCFERLWSAYRPQNEVVPTWTKPELKVKVHTI